MNLPVYFEVLAELPDESFEVLDQGRSTQQELEALRERFERMSEEHQCNLLVTASILH